MKVFCRDLSANFNMSEIENPCLATSVITAPQIERALKVEASIPDICNNSFSHLATVAEDTGLSELIKDNNNLLGFEESFFLQETVRFCIL